MFHTLGAFQPDKNGNVQNFSHKEEAKKYLSLHCPVEFTYLLNASNALRGAVGILHFGVALCVGQKPVVRTRTLKSTPCKCV
jgi:hypothetical protein